MDPVCHTLAGAAMAESGLKTKTSYGTATLLIAANLPDMDVTSLLWDGPVSLAVRRGVTHGLPAMLVLPPLLALAVLAWHRVRAPAHTAGPAFGWLVVLGYLGVVSHPLLDLLNVYGIRLLAPLSDRWFYGDVLFIVDPFLWLIFGWGVTTARRKNREGKYYWAKPARASLVVAVVYILVMTGMARWFESLAGRELEAAGITASRVMVSPLPLNPFRRWFVAETGGEYRFGYISAFGEHRLDLYPESYRAGPDSDAARFAAGTPDGRHYLRWARFPYFQTERRIDGAVVWIGDARYTLDPQGSWAGIGVWVETP